MEELSATLAELEGKSDEMGLPPAVVPGLETDDQYFISFDREKYGVDAGSSVTINYSLPETATVEVSPREGWGVSVNSSGATGQIVITAPDAASPAMLSGQKSF